MPTVITSISKEHMFKELDLDGVEMLEKALSNPPSGAGFDTEEVADAVRMEVWISLFSHPSETDFYIYDIYDAEDNLIASKRVDGY